MHQIMSGEDFRRPGLLENYYIARSYLGFDSCVVVGVKYRGQDGAPLSKHNLYPALAKVIQKYAALSAHIKDAKSKGVSIARLETLDLSAVVEFSDVSLEDDSVRDAFLEGEFKRPLLPVTGQPLWRLTVTADGFVVLAWSHIIGDGLSGLVFHRALLSALNDSTTPPNVSDESLEEAVVVPRDVALLLPLENLTNLSVSAGTFFRALAGVFIPRTWYEGKIWTGNKVVQETQLSKKNNVRSINIPSETTARLLSLSKEHGVSLTATLYVACVGVLSTLIETNSKDKATQKSQRPKFTSVATAVAVSLRAVAKVANDDFGNIISAFSISERLRTLKANDIGATFPWDIAASYMKKLHDGIPKTRETIGTIKYLFGNYEGFFLSKLGKKRQLGLEISNLGSFKVHDGDAAAGIWSLGTAYFGQDDRIAGSALKVTVVGGPDGSLGIVISWGDGAVDDDFADAFVRDFLDLVSKIR